MDSASLVSVIVPAWNAQRTLVETLRSAAAQTHRDLEILIVDDGSTDATAELARRFCETEPRARLIRKANGGVASARNAAIEAAKGTWIAPLDADDLWHPEKIERQLDTFAQGRRELGLVYCWYRLIDEAGRICAPPWAPVVEGWAFSTHLLCSFGTGSSPLIRRSALGDLRYSEELRASGNEGSEDWLLQLMIAAGHQVGCTRAFLLGYRTAAGNMSSNTVRMMRSHAQMFEIVLRDLPGREPRLVRRELRRWRARAALSGSLPRPLAEAGGRLWAFATMPVLGAKVALFDLYRQVRSAGGGRSADKRALIGRPFASVSPDDLS